MTLLVYAMQFLKYLSCSFQLFKLQIPSCLWCLGKREVYILLNRAVATPETNSLDGLISEKTFFFFFLRHIYYLSWVLGTSHTILGIFHLPQQKCHRRCCLFGDRNISGIYSSCKDAHRGPHYLSIVLSQHWHGVPLKLKSQRVGSFAIHWLSRSPSLNEPWILPILSK